MSVLSAACPDVLNMESAYSVKPPAVTVLDPDSALPATASSPTLPPSLFLIPVDVIEHIISTRTTTGNIVDTLPVRHHYSDGCYARELFIPAGILATARRHRTHHLCILSAGEVTIWEEGVEPVVYTAPCTFVGKPGARRIGYVHSPTVWVNVFPLAGAPSLDPVDLLDRFMEVVPPHMTSAEIENYLDVLRSLDSGEGLGPADASIPALDWTGTAQLLLPEGKP
jgi:hypothetical protein